MSEQKLTQKKLKELLDYNPCTGVFIWRVYRAQTAKIGDIAGTIGVSGYIHICVLGKGYRANRLAWLYIEGYCPVGYEVDHKDRDKLNNKFSNLRLLTHSCNSKNKKINKKNISGISGITFYKPNKKWLARIMVDGKAIHLGYFNNTTDAAIKRYTAEIENGFNDCNYISSAKEFLIKNNINVPEVCRLTPKKRQPVKKYIRVKTISEYVRF